MQTLLFVAGINTLFQTYFGTRLPAVIGGSYTFVMPTISIILAGRYSDIIDPHEVRLKQDLDWNCVSIIQKLETDDYFSFFLEIPAHYAWNAGCTNCRFDSANYYWF